MVSETCTGPAENIKVCSRSGKGGRQVLWYPVPNNLPVHSCTTPSHIAGSHREFPRGGNEQRGEADGEKGL